jgi:tRNA threonylcarbamoyladenosine biosynthesis protein TsaE
MGVDDGLSCRWKTCSELETERIGRLLSAVLLPGSVVLLDGDLGAGKSVFARGVIWGIGVTEPYITSPTFTLMNTYTQGRIPVYHFDFYRLALPDELALTGCDEYLEGDGVALIEWAAKGGAWIPEDHLLVELRHQEENSELRIVELRAVGHRSREVFVAFRQRYADCPGGYPVFDGGGW